MKKPMFEIIEKILNIHSGILTNANSQRFIPKSVKLELSGICNHKCKFCAVPLCRSLNLQAYMKKDVLFRTLYEIERLNISEIGLFHMGESTLHPNFCEYVSLIRKRFMQLHMFLTTNGTNLHCLKHAIFENVNSVKFSINGYNRKIHYELTNVDDFELIIANLVECIRYRNAIRSKTQITISSIDFKSHEQYSFLNKLSEIVDDGFLTPLYSHAGKILDNQVSQQNNAKNVACKFPVVDVCAKVPCASFFSLCHIKTNGNINICRFGIDDEFNVGNILIDNIDDIWNSLEMNLARKRHLSNSISTCNRCIRRN